MTVVAPLGTVAMISMSELTSNAAGAPSNFTDEVPVYPTPVIVTVVPAGPLDGSNKTTVGGGDGVTTKSTALAPVPSASATDTGPVVAPTGTIAVICRSVSTLEAFPEPPLHLGHEQATVPESSYSAW